MPSWRPTRESDAVVKVAQRQGWPYALEVPMWEANIDLVQEREGVLHCLEFKYGAWRRCLAQAMCHRIATPWCWVVLDRASAAARHEVRAQGLGLATFTNEGVVVEVFPPIDTERVWAPIAAKLRANFEWCRGSARQSSGGSGGKNSVSYTLDRETTRRGRQCQHP